MRVCIHRGAHQIGGTCIEIESQGKRIVLDVGLPLDVADADAMPLPPVPGFAAPDPSLLGVVISHPHQDHYGLAYRLPPETTFLIGQAAQNILSAAAVFAPNPLRLDRVLHLQDRKGIVLGPFRITPYLMDHSAYDAYAIHVQADGVGLFYTGDLRAHGRKAKLFHKLLRLPPKRVDALLMEGTTIGRGDPGQGPATEEDLEARFVRLFRRTAGMPLVWCSGQNIDRLVTIFRACKRSGRQFIVDLYTAQVLQATGNKRIPQGGWEGLRVFVPLSQRICIKKRREFALIDHHKAWRIFPEDLAPSAADSVVLFRPSMMGDMDRAKCLASSRMIYSMWAGYLHDPRQDAFHRWLLRRGIPLDECHTSGHATVQDLVKLRKVFKRAPVVPIHTDQPARFAELFENVRQQADHEWWEVAG